MIKITCANSRLKKKVIVGILLLVAVIIGYCLWRELFLEKEGFVGIENVEIDGVEYQYEEYAYSDRGEMIALVDEWGVYEVPEDPSHTFLILGRGLADDYIVREDYRIPTEGNVSCAYIGRAMVRTTDEKILGALTEILQADYANGTEYMLYNSPQEPYGFRQVIVGYEDCPVGTDESIYYIGKVNSKWIIIFQHEVGELQGDKIPSIYYELDERYGKIFEESGLWETNYYEYD